MKYCYQCGRITPGEPLYCNSCGRSYDVKLCPRNHSNPRSAEVCSQCGSREFSMPQPKVSIWWRILEFLARVLLGIALVFVSLAALVAALRELFPRPEVQGGLVILGILLILLWWLWCQLPEWFRKLIHKSLKRKDRDHGHFGSGK
jgi:hypothetical protein